MSLKDKRAVVTGGSRGLGLGLVEALVAEGANVTVVARGMDALKAVEARLGVAAISADITDRAAANRILADIQPDILALNAGATLALAAITISGAARAADVYAFALLSGLIFAFDGPARQSFVTEVVPEGQLRAGIALNAAVFQATRLIGPAIASLLINNGKLDQLKETLARLFKARTRFSPRRFP